MSDKLAARAREIAQVIWHSAEHDNAFSVERMAALIASYGREAAKEALEQYAVSVDESWGQAYPLEAFPEVQKGEVSDALRSRCSASMGRHMARRISEEVRARAAAIREGN